MRVLGLWSMLKPMAMVMLLGVYALAPELALADDGDQPTYHAYVFEGACDGAIMSQPVEDLGELVQDHDGAAELAADVEPEPAHVQGVDGHLKASLGDLTTGKHVVAVRQMQQEGVSPVVACGEIPEDAGDEFDVELAPFGDTGVEGKARIETITRVEATTTYAVGLWDSPPDDSAASDRDMPEAPDFELKLFDGKTVHLSDYRGKTVLMVMWASWCPYCNKEFPMFEDIWQTYKDKDVVVLGVGLKNDDQGDAEDFVEKHGATFPIGRDTEGGDGVRGEIESTLGVPGTPAMFIITPDGHVYGAQYGVVEQGQIEDAIKDASTYDSES